MKRYLIENAQCGITDGGMACGPVFGNVIATVRFKEDEKTRYLSLADVGGIPNFYLSEQDMFDDMIREDPDDEEFIDVMDAAYITDFNGLELGCDFADVFNSIHEDPDNPAVPLLRFIITLVRCSMDDVDGLIKMASGKYADELEIPLSDVEEDFIEELEEYEEEEDDEEEEDEDDEEEEDEEDESYEWVAPKGGEVLILETEHVKRGLEVEPISPCCADEKNVVQLVDEWWRNEPEAEKAQYTKYQIVRTTRVWSDVIGFVYDSNGEVIKKYI